MPALHIVTAPNPKLAQVSEMVSEITPEVKTLVRDMLETMYQDRGVGLAAIQVGIAKQVIVIDLKDDDEKLVERAPDFYPLVLINPKITFASEEHNIALEGCLSVPSLRLEVTRPSSIKLEYLNLHSKHCNLEADGWLARVIQHEMDHLNGKLLLDYLSPLKKDLALKKLKKFQKELL